MKRRNEVVMSPTPDLTRSGKKRARMGGVDKTPEGPTPRKRKPVTRTRTTLREYFTASKDKENKPDEEQELVPLDKVNQQQTSKSNSSTMSLATATIVQSTGPAGKYSPNSRWGHSVSMISEKEAVVIGGQGDKQAFCKDSIWYLNMDHQLWNKPDTSAQGPNPELRMGHTAVYDHTVRCIYVFGGSKNLKWFNDVHVLDIDEWKWELVKANGKAPTRAYHSASLFRHELWIFGGVFPQPDPKPDGSSNDIYVFSPIQENWYMPIVMGEKPAPRSGQSTTVLDDKLVMFGGWDMPIVFSDLHVLDLTFIEWSQPTTTGTPPSPRSWHASCALSGNRMMIHGGYDGNVALQDCFIFDLDSKTWTEIDIQPSIACRAGHTALCTPYKPANLDNDCVWLFGGGDNDGSFYDDLINLMIPRTANVKAIENDSSASESTVLSDKNTDNDKKSKK